MRTGDYLRDILGAFARRPLRTALTATGIGIGAFAITLMVGLGYGLQRYLTDQFITFGNERVLIVYPASVRLGERLLERLKSFGRPARPLTEEDERLRRVRRGGLWITPEQAEAARRIPGVRSLAPMTWLEVDGIRLAGGPPDAPFYETDFALLATSPLVGRPSAGRLPRPDEPDAVLLAPQYATSFHLAPGELVGRTIEIRVPKLSGIPQRFLFRDPTRFREASRLFTARVVGLAERSPFSRVCFLSIPLGREMARYESDNPDLLSDRHIGFQAQLELEPGVDPSTVRERLAEIGLAARSVDDSLSDLNAVFTVVNAVLTSFGLLALLVATLGITNTLLMATTERTREIGLLKALGMTDRVVYRLFALEAAAIGLVGGTVGTLSAVLLGFLGDILIRRYVPAAAQLEGYQAFAFPIWLLVGAPLFSSLVGGLAGLYPARRAAGLDPIDALRHE